MKLGITGATGFVGKRLIRAATRRGMEVVAFTRSPERTVGGCVETRLFSLEKTPDFSGCDAAIHLAGENVSGLWIPAKVRRIRDSRVVGARRVAEGIRAAKQPPECLVAASAIGFYGNCGDADVTEESPRGNGFLSDVCAQNEGELRPLDGVCRVVNARIGLVLGEGGALGVMRPLFKLGLGGPISNGRQWMSWIHVEDAVSLLLFAVLNLDIRGPLNVTAPWPVRNTDFTKTLARSVHRPAIFRAPAFALRLVLRGFADELLWSRRVLPAVATSHGFGYQFPELTEQTLGNFS